MPTLVSSAAKTPADPFDWTLWDEDSINSDPMVRKRLPLRLQAAERLRERLSCVPFYAKRARRHKDETGDEMGYWLDLQGSEGRIEMPPEVCSTASLEDRLSRSEVESLRQSAIALNAYGQKAFQKI